MELWTELDRRLGSIKRYNLFKTIQTQTVAEHVFNVERVASRLAVEWFQLPPWDVHAVMLWAHHHEDTEALSGDFPAMAKPFFDEAAFEEANKQLLQASSVNVEFSGRTKIIVKIADLMDCYMFFAMELALGNQYCENHLTAMHQRLTDYVARKCPEHSEKLHDWLMDNCVPRSQTFHKKGWSEDNQ